MLGLAVSQSKKEAPSDASQRGLGIDVGAEFSYVAVLSGQAKWTLRRSGCLTVDLRALADWLQARAVAVA